MKKYLISLLIVFTLLASFVVPNSSMHFVTMANDVDDNWVEPFLSAYVTDSDGTDLDQQSNWHNLQNGYLYLRINFQTGSAKGKTIHDYFDFGTYDGSLSNIDQFQYKDPTDNQWKDARSVYENSEHTFLADKDRHQLFLRMNFTNDLTFTFKYCIDSLDGEVTNKSTRMRYVKIENGKAIFTTVVDKVTTVVPTTIQPTTQIDPADIQYNVEDYGEGKPLPYPEKDGTIFAGWYTDKTYSVPYTESTGKAYAKFVDKNVFKVKKQTNGDNSAVRFVSTVDTLDYQKVGFLISGTYGTYTINSTEKYTESVYMSLKAAGQSVNIKEAFCESSNYFYTYTIRGMNPSNKLTIKVIPIFITPDGTNVQGDEYNFEIN